jgi:hypothetical protein
MGTTKGWQPATVVRIRDELRWYDIITPTGARYRTNRKHLRPGKTVRYRDNEEVTITD